MKRKTKITSVMLIYLVCASGFSILMRGNTNYKHDENSESFSRNLKSSGTGWTTTEVVPTEPANSVNNPSIVVDGVGNVTFLFQSSK